MDIQEYLQKESEKEILRFSTAGSVDDGKSTLIGRLLHDSKSIYEDQLSAISSKKAGMSKEIDWALLTDGLKAEREQGITIDVAYRYFSTPKRKFIIADTPGHEQYTRNMATGASTANLAIVLLDARNGIRPQSKRHAFIASLLQIPHMVVAVNKMDLVDYQESVFEQIKDEFEEFSTRLRVSDMRFVPISALMGDNVVERSPKMPWYKGESLLELLEDIHIASDRNFLDMRFPVQTVVRPHQDFRGYCGQVASGILRKDDEVLVLPSMKTSRVRSIVTYDGELQQAFPPLSVCVTLDDEIDISRGDMLVHMHNRPHVGRHFEAMVIWMDDEPMDLNAQYYLKHTSHTTKAKILEARYKVDVNTLSREPAPTLAMNEIARLVLLTHQPINADPYERNRTTGSFVLIDSLTHRTVAAGMIINREPRDQLPVKMEVDRAEPVSPRVHRHKVSAEERAKRLAQRPVTIWMTGHLSSGKSDMAEDLERAIFDRGGLATTLHGGDMRRGMSRELEFTRGDLAEHLRRVAETARILNETGLIAICPLVSPVAGLREQVKEIIGADHFIEVFVDASVAWCEKRDETGLYKKARQGLIKNLPGVNSMYEPPSHPDIHLPMERTSREDAVASVMRLLESWLTT